MGKREQELAHTAGLLHDIGRFALSDRVMEREGRLNEEDWTAIRRHPAIGADLLKDVGVYGPVAEIVLCHHERIDGRGYPRGLKGDEIPEIARIVAVAEVYDTLTAPDTYRTQMNSFEALTELRRVAGRQLDGRFVEALGRAARRPGHRVPPRRRRRLRRRAGHRAADERGRRPDAASAALGALEAVLLLERREERVELLDREAALAARGAVAAQVAHVGPAADGAERDAEVAGRLGG